MPIFASYKYFTSQYIAFASSEYVTEVIEMCLISLIIFS